MSDEQEFEDVDNAALEKEAKTMGWVPEKEFKGPKDHWVSAEEYVEKGRAVMPILLANNKRLQNELLTRDHKLDTLETQLNNAQIALEKLDKHYNEANKRAVEQAKTELMAQLKVAREDDDVEGEEAIREKLAALKDAPDEPAKVTPQPKTDDALSSDFKDWVKDNDWFNTDKKRAKAIIRISEDLRDDGIELTGRAFMDLCLEKLLETEGGDPEGDVEVKRPTSKVETNGTRGSSRSNNKSFADLPSEAKQACWGDVEDLVGPDKRYKTKAAWEKDYARIYWGME